MKSRLRRARRIALAVGAGLPVALTAAAFVVMIVVLPQVPDPAATHWAVDGSADGFAPAHTYLWMLLGMGLALPVGMTAAMLAATHNNWGITPRMLASVSAALATFSAVSMPGSLWIQRGLVDASAAPSVLPVLFAALGAGVVVGTLAWLMQPALRLLPGVEAAPAGEVRLRPGEHVAWVGTATIARSGIVVLGIGLGILLVLTVVLAGSPAGWIVLVTTVVVGALVVSSATIRVRIGRSGLAVRSPLGWPKFALPLDEIARGEAVHVAPFVEFGGWGWRWGLDGRRGAVMRTGDALQVTGTDGSIRVATVDHAAEAASVLTALLEETNRPAEGNDDD